MRLRHALPLSALLLAGAALRAEPVKGVIKSVDRPNGLLTLLREDTKTEISGYAVTGDLAPGRVGSFVSAEYLASDVSGKSFRFENLRPADAAGEKIIADTAVRLRTDTRERGRNASREVGDALPVFALRDQDGRVVTNADLAGKYVVISFIFTRCKEPTMCPATTHKMVELSKALKAAGVTNALLLSISFDPVHDTPGVLKDYADGNGADGSVHKFLTGPKPMIDDLQRQFGILTIEDDNTIVHNVATTLVSPAGRILYRADGPRWEPETVVARLAKHRGGK